MPRLGFCLTQHMASAKSYQAFAWYERTVPAIHSTIDTASAAFVRNRDHMLALIGRLRGLEARARDRSAQAKPLFDKRGQMLPRDRIARLLDIGAPWLELSSIAGCGLDTSECSASFSARVSLQ